MTEAEWLTCTDPTPMLEFLQGKASDRKLRLFCVTCCRRLWHLLDEDHCRRLIEFGRRANSFGCSFEEPPLDSCHKAVELAERSADEAVSPDALHALSEASISLQYPSQDYCACYVESWGPFDGELVASGNAAFAASDASLPSPHPAGVAGRTVQAAGYMRTKVFGEPDASGIAEERSCHCGILRDIFGNPFRRVQVDPRSLTSKVTALAQAIYGDRAFDRLPVLAHALEEAGCTNADILDHCRKPGPHVRGCWVVDMILGKE